MIVRKTLAVLAALAVAWASAAQERPVVRIATEGGFPPFNYVGPGDQPQGFEVDLARALCEAMGADCAVVLQNWEGMIEGLLAKRFDAVMASMPITDERRRRIAFSKPYYRMPAAFIVRKDAASGDVSPAALKGKAVGATARSEHAAYLEDLYKGSEIRLYPNPEDAGLDLAAGRLDAVLGDKLALWRFLQTPRGSCCRFDADAPPNPAYFGEGVGVGLRKEDKALKEMFNRAIDRIAADGTYDRIRAKYFSFDVR